MRINHHSEYSISGDHKLKKNIMQITKFLLGFVTLITCVVSKPQHFVANKIESSTLLCDQQKREACQDHLKNFSKNCDEICELCDLCAIIENGKEEVSECKHCSKGRERCVEACEQGLTECAACGINR